MDSITFIIPTIGRKTLENSIISLQNQTIQSWKAIIIFDGIKCNFKIDDNRIKIIESEKLGENINSAGNVRNLGISKSNTKWIAFLDDDDVISNDYIELFYNELNLNKDLDVLIFRMKMDNRIIPNLLTNNFYICDVGISFIMKREIFDNNLYFAPSGVEDFAYLNKIRESNYKIIISPFIKYFVKESIPNEILDIGNRVYINYNTGLYILLKGYSKLFFEKLK
jgi:glycosyltransferase involved in cell wall biosynthesis